MSIYQHILLAVDLSPTSWEIALKARELARNNQAKLSLVYVLDLPPAVDIGYESTLACDDQLNDILTRNAELDLADFIKHLKLDLHQSWLLQGDSVEEIVEIAKANQVDLIVMGSHGKHGLALWFGGSTANSMLHHARCDVLTVYLGNE
jgi:universal stress protein A